MRSSLSDLLSRLPVLYAACRACRSRRAHAPRPVRLPLRTSPRRRRHRRSSGTGRAGGRLSVLCPKGVPVPALPWTKWSDVGPLLVGAVGIILVSLTDTIVTATNFASRRGDEVDPDQEMAGIGTSNVAAGFFQGFAVSASGCRAAVVDQSGARTQLTGLVGARLVAVLLLFLNGLLGLWMRSSMIAACIWHSSSHAMASRTWRAIHCT